MTLTRLHLRQPGQLLKRAALALALLALVAATATAQQFASLLPQETFVAVGVSGLAEHEAKFQPFIDEWQRLDLATLFTEAFPEEEAGELDEFEDAMPAEFEGLGLFDFLGDEAWFAVSASRTSPLPAFTVVARVSPEAAAALQTVLERETDDGDFQVLTEGNIEFRVGASAEFDEPLAFAIDDTFVTVSSNPDVLRGVLRRYQGASEPSFIGSRGYSETLATLMPSNQVVYFDLSHIVDLAEPFAKGMGFDATVDRLARTLRTFGTYGSVTRITDEGTESLSLQVLGDPSLDPSLHALLSANLPASSAPLGFVADDAVSYQAFGLDVGGWWDYLDELVMDLPELGIGSLNAFIRDNLGLDLNTMLFDWMGTTMATVTGYSAPVDIGVMPENVLGNAVYLIETTDPASADMGLSMLIQMGGMFASSFADPYGEGAGATPTPTERTVAGVTVDSYAVADGVVIEVAIVGGFVVLATSPASMDAALEANARGGGLTGELAALANQVPSGAGTIMLQDGATTLRMAGEQLTSQFGLFTGLLSSDIDFDAAEAASDALGEYIEFVAGKFGGQYAYGVADDGVLRSYSHATIDW